MQMFKINKFRGIFTLILHSFFILEILQILLVIKVQLSDSIPTISSVHSISNVIFRVSVVLIWNNYCKLSFSSNCANLSLFPISFALMIIITFILSFIIFVNILILFYISLFSVSHIKQLTVINYSVSLFLCFFVLLFGLNSYGFKYLNPHYIF